MTDSPVKELWADYRFSCPILGCSYGPKHPDRTAALHFGKQHLLTHDSSELVSLLERLGYLSVDVCYPEPEPEPEPFTL